MNEGRERAKKTALTADLQDDKRLGRFRKSTRAQGRTITRGRFSHHSGRELYLVGAPSVRDCGHRSSVPLLALIKIATSAVE